jgi:tetratricopeptide (TPR) repeat protein
VRHDVFRRQPIITYRVALLFGGRYNIGHVGVALGDLGLAYQAFKVAVSVDPNHGEALNNVAVLELRRQKFDLARSCLTSAVDVGPHLFEPLYNSGLRFISPRPEVTDILF